jgi:hypothetical protein
MSGGHFAGGAHFAAPHAFGGAHYAPAGHYGGGYAWGGGHYYGHPGGWAGHPGAGWAPGNAYWHGGHYWYGGYWHGVFWPHVWFNPGYAWFLPVLPLGYATFWWGGVPYYYWNNIYYTWNPGYNGYVVTDPPPVAGTDNAADSGDSGYSDNPDYSGGGYTQAAPPPPGATAPPPATAPAGAGNADVYLYPRNGQSDAQMQNDRYECHSWAVGQTGFDPTRPAGAGGNAAEYRRAMIACLDARGYSAR